MSVLLGVAAVVIAVASSRVSAADVASEVAPAVTAAQIAESRGQRVRNARAVLDAANRALTARGLPAVADPGPGANAEQISTAASTAQVLGLIPEDVAQLLRQENPGPVVVLPTADGTVTPPDAGGSSGGPGASQGSSSPGSSGGGSGGQDSGGNSAGAPDSGSGAPANPSTPAPARPRPAAPGPAAPAQPAAPERRLLPQLLPFPFPLIGD